MVVIINFCAECQLDIKYTNQISAKSKKRKRFSTCNILSKYSVININEFFFITFMLYYKR